MHACFVLVDVVSGVDERDERSDRPADASH